MDTKKPLKDWTFDELVGYNKGCILIAIGEGEFHSAVWSATNLALQWRLKQEAKAKEKSAK